MQQQGRMKKNNINALNKVVNFQLLRRIFSYAKPYSERFYISIILALVLAIMSPIRPMLINFTLKRMTTDSGSPATMLLEFLLLITLIQIGVLFLEVCLRFLFSYTTSWLGHRVVKDIRVAVYEKILSLKFFSKKSQP